MFGFISAERNADGSLEIFAHDEKRKSFSTRLCGHRSPGIVLLQFCLFSNRQADGVFAIQRVLANRDRSCAFILFYLGSCGLYQRRFFESDGQYVPREEFYNNVAYIQLNCR